MRVIEWSLGVYGGLVDFFVNLCYLIIVVVVEGIY